MVTVAEIKRTALNSSIMYCDFRYGSFTGENALRYKFMLASLLELEVWVGEWFSLRGIHRGLARGITIIG